MAFTEFSHDFGAVTASTTGAFSIETTMRGNPNVPWNSMILYAVVRNQSTGTVTVFGGIGTSTVAVGERKRIEFPYNTKFFRIVPAATTSAGDVTADVGIDGVVL